MADHHGRTTQSQNVEHVADPLSFAADGRNFGSRLAEPEARAIEADDGVVRLKMTRAVIPVEPIARQPTAQDDDGAVALGKNMQSLSPTCKISPGGFTWNNSGTRESGLLTRFREGGEGQRLADAATRDQHDDSVDAHPETTRRRHRVFEGLEEVFVQFHRFRVAAGREHRLLGEPVALIHRVGQLAVCGSEFDAPPRHQVPLLATPGMLRCGRVSGDIEVGKLV